MIGLHWSAVVPASSWTVALQQQQLPPADSVVVESPLPGGVAAVTRFLLTTVPPWMQLGGLVVAAVVAAFVIRYLVRHRQAIRAWFGAQSRGVMWAIAAGTMVMVTAIVGMGAATWNYTQHSNDFCTSCHVMGTAFQKFSAAENKHGELSCHDCHQQSVFDSVWQLYVWIRERPDEIGQHSAVPNQVCETCHVTGDTARWQTIASTAGHRVHFESDSSTLDSLQCVTCHGVEVHRFKPVSGTCGQSGCHEAAETNIVLGKMAEQTASHCTNCHVFTADVPALATRDSARGTLVPGRPQCFGCHDMKKVLPDFDEAKDPHGGKCGTCHNPHQQKTPGEAAQTCATAACHANWREEPFHVGASHKRVGERCLTCHLPHQARVDASDCTGCHNSVRSRGNLRPPLPFDTTKALRRVSVTPRSAWPHETAASRQPPASKTQPATPASDSAETIERPRRSGPAADAAFAPEFSDDDVVRVSWPPPASADTFSHTRHAKLACLVCHQTGAPNRRLTFEPPRGCTICHHQTPASSRCALCHRTEQVAAPMPVTVTVTVPGHPPRARPVDFLHTSHAQQACVGCHTTPGTLAPAPAIAQCKSCHSEHHATTRTCSACHSLTDPKAQHRTLDAAHQRCDACHTGTTVAQLTPTRSFCSTCHVPKATNHYDQKECTTCHFLADPGVYRSKLTTASR